MNSGDGVGEWGRERELGEEESSVVGGRKERSSADFIGRGEGERDAGEEKERRPSKPLTSPYYH
jgi:hypothetical protein